MAGEEWAPLALFKIQAESTRHRASFAERDLMRNCHLSIKQSNGDLRSSHLHVTRRQSLDEVPILALEELWKEALQRKKCEAFYEDVLRTLEECGDTDKAIGSWLRSTDNEVLGRLKGYLSSAWQRRDQEMYSLKEQMSKYKSQLTKSLVGGKIHTDHIESGHEEFLAAQNLVADAPNLLEAERKGSDRESFSGEKFEAISDQLNQIEVQNIRLVEELKQVHCEYSKRKTELNSRFSKLVEKNEKLGKEFQVILNENKSLGKEVETLLKENERLRKEVNSVLGMNEELRKEKENISKNSERVNEKNKRLSAECGDNSRGLKRLSKEKDGLYKENKHLLLEIKKLEEGIENMNKVNGNLASQNGELIKENKILSKEAEDLNNENEKLNTDNRTLEEKITSLNRDKEKLIEDSTTLRQENEKLYSENRNLCKENGNLYEENSKLHEELNSARKSYSDLQASTIEEQVMPKSKRHHFSFRKKT